jgi:hypothetical protein
VKSELKIRKERVGMGQIKDYIRKQRTQCEREKKTHLLTSG